jgi:hypothetical protein
LPPEATVLGDVNVRHPATGEMGNEGVPV